MNERKELLNMLREMWQKGDSPLHRIYSSWEELEGHVNFKIERKGKSAFRPCPNCGVKQKVTKPVESFFPYRICKSCNHAFYVNSDLTVRELTAEEREEMPATWVRIVEDFSKKKLAIVFKLE
jgi:hypothetical protein